MLIEFRHVVLHSSLSKCGKEWPERHSGIEKDEAEEVLRWIGEQNEKVCPICRVVMRQESEGKIFPDCRGVVAREE